MTRCSDVTSDADLPTPELLPCGYIVGDVDCISLQLKGAYTTPLSGCRQLHV